MNNDVFETVRLGEIVGGGQTIATLQNGKKIFVWGGLPGELVEIEIYKQRSKLAEGMVTKVIEASPSRIKPLDDPSFLSTSPWQIMSFKSEQHHKAELIKDAFKLHDVSLPGEIKVYSDNREYGYRNKMEFSWWFSKESNELDLAFFRRGSHNKVPVFGSSLAMEPINKAATKIRNLLRSKSQVKAYMLKTLLIRCDQAGNVAAQLYVKEKQFEKFSLEEIRDLEIQGFEVIYSNPKSPASVISERLESWGKNSLSDSLLNLEFNYAVEGFFQINLPVYEKALADMKTWINPDQPIIDLYSGVGTIGLTVGSQNLTMIEVDKNAYAEMEKNIESLNRQGNTKSVLAPSEQALDYIDGESTIIVDPPRAGLHEDVINRLTEVKPKRIIYLSCNPVTQARDVALLINQYSISWHMGYNFFPRTPHIENLVVLDLK